MRFNRFHCLMLGLLLLVPLISYGALPVFDWVNYLLKRNIFNEEKQFWLKQVMLTEHFGNASIEQLTQQVKALTGHSPYGELVPNVVWNNINAETPSLEHLLTLYQQESQGEVSGIVNQLVNEFPLTSNTQTNWSTALQHYTTLQSQTALATRASSNSIYNEITNAIAHQHQLQTQIGQTNNLKEAIDLQNRLTVENNLIALLQLRLEALSQHLEAVNTQGDSLSQAQTHQFFSLTKQVK